MDSTGESSERTEVSLKPVMNIRSGPKKVLRLVGHQFNLGWKLALVERGLADKSLLETNSTERLPVISEMLKFTTPLLNHALSSELGQA
jgi:hypothetical protein